MGEGEEEDEPALAEIPRSNSKGPILKKVGSVGLRFGGVGLLTAAGIGLNNLLHNSDPPEIPPTTGIEAATEPTPSPEEKARKELNSIISFMANSDNQDLENLANRSSALQTIGKLGAGMVNGGKAIETQIIGGDSHAWKIILSDKMLEEHRLSKEDWAFYLFKESLTLTWAEKLQGSTLERKNAFDAEREQLDEKNWKITFGTLGPSFAGKITDPNLISIRNKYMPPPSPPPSKPGNWRVPV